jgi:nucleoside-diphosphate-sugar epimerase
MALKIMILGANGFIGSALTNAILRTRDWEVYGIDLADNKLGDLPKDTGRVYMCPSWRSRIRRST